MSASHRHVFTIFILASLATIAASAQARRETGVIDLAAATLEIGFCYTVPIAPACKPDSLAGQISSLRLLEDGNELGPGHAGHQAIRNTGGGGSLSGLLRHQQPESLLLRLLRLLLSGLCVVRAARAVERTR